MATTYHWLNMITPPGGLAPGEEVLSFQEVACSGADRHGYGQARQDRGPDMACRRLTHGRVRFTYPGKFALVETLKSLSIMGLMRR
jgi:hypothetical protein